MSINLIPQKKKKKIMQFLTFDKVQILVLFFKLENFRA